MIWRKLLFAFLVSLMLLVNFGEARAQRATNGEWWATLDSTFHWGDLNLPVGRAPSSLSNLSLRRAFVLGLVPEGASEAILSEPVLYRTVADNLSELFFLRLRGFTFLSEVKNELMDFGINIDSLEAVARGLPVGDFSAIEDDTMSLNVLQVFAARALESPVILIPSFDWTAGDTTSAEVKMANNRLNVAAYRTTIASELRFSLVEVVGANNFQTFFEPTFSFGQTSFALGGLKTDSVSGIGAASFDLAELEVVPEDSGNFSVFGDNAVIADTGGIRDFPAWPHKTVWGIFSRFDANQDFLTTISDAVFAAMAILRGRPLPLLHLGDVNRNGLLDPDDPLIIFEEAFSGSAAGAVLPEITSEASAKGVVRVKGSEETNGKVTIEIGFEGDFGDAKRFASRLKFDPQVLSFETVNFELPVISAISGSHLDSTSALRTLIYPNQMAAHNLLRATFKRIGSGDIKVGLEPLVHDNFLAFGEEVRVEYSGLTGVGDEGVLVPRSYELRQNYPNPFNPGTTIEYSLSKQEFVTVVVYNLLGQKVGTLVEGIRAAGRHSVSFDGKDLPSGLYFYRLEAGGFTETKKMVLLH